MTDGRSRLATAAHPAVVAALVVLVVNDHVLKGWSGGVAGSIGVVARTATGKASDLAGVLLLTIVLGLVLGRRPAVAAVAIGFTALKLSPTVAEAAAPLLGGHTRTDPTDLLALIALVPAHHLLHDLPPLDLRPAWASTRATLGLAVVLLSVPAMTATSCPDGPTGVNRAAVLDDGRVVVWEGADDGSTTPSPTTTTTTSAIGPTAVDEGVVRWTSRDRGRTWQREQLDPAERAQLSEGDEEEDEDAVVCTATGCVRPGGGAVIEERGADGVWLTSFEYSEDERAVFEANSAGCNRELSPGIGEAVAVDDTVVVTATVAGIVRREPGGDWEQVSVGEWETPADRPPAWLRHLVWSPVPALALFAVLFWGTIARSPRRTSWRPFSVFLAVLGLIGGGGLSVAVLVFGATPTELGRVVGVLTGIVVAVAILPLVPLLIWPRAQEVPPPTGPAPPGPPGPPGPPVSGPGVRPGPERRPDPPPPPGPSGWI